MRGVILTDIHDVQVRDIPDAEIKDSTDVLMRVTSTAICGTDLHFYDGRMPYNGHLIGHEPLGVVEEVGDAVHSLRKGDRIVVPTHICCGFCPNCTRGFSGSCLTTHPGAAGAAYGYPDQGGWAGAQTELLRVPFADANAMKLPGEAGERLELERDCTVLAWAEACRRHQAHRTVGHQGDILPAAFHAVEAQVVNPPEAGVGGTRLRHGDFLKE